MRAGGERASTGKTIPDRLCLLPPDISGCNLSRSTQEEQRDARSRRQEQSTNDDAARETLQSWKEIAAYLDRDESTARRWEREASLPVRRHREGGRSSVYAFASELDAWRQARKPKVGESVPQKPLWRWAAAAFAGAFAIALAVWIVAEGPILNPPDPLAEAANVTGSVSLSQVGTDPAAIPTGSVSPDGRYLSFSDSTTGDLVVHDLETGENRRLTKKGSWFESSEASYSSTFSPDGTQIAFSWLGASSEVRILPADAKDGEVSAKVLYSSPQDEATYLHVAGWSPDGKHILVYLTRRDRTSQIAMVSASDGKLRVLRSLEWSFPNLKLSPDGRFIGYDRPAGEDPRRDIFVLAADGTREAAMVPHPANDIIIGWTPDGGALLFASDRSGTMGVWSLPLADGKPAVSPELLKRDVGQVAPISITSGGAFYYGLQAGMQDVFTAELDPASGKLLGEPKGFQSLSDGSNRAAAWSPDGTHLAYLGGGGRGGAESASPLLVIRSFEDGKERTIAPSGLQIRTGRLDWSPDGRHILLAAQHAKGSYGASTIDVATEEARLVAKAGEFGIYPFGWSADSKEVFYRSTRLVGEDQVYHRTIFTRNLETGEERQVYSVEGTRMVGGAVSPDGKYLAFTLFTDNAPKQQNVYERELVVLPTSGGDPRRVLTFEGHFDLAWSPDGRYLYFIKESRREEPVEVWRVPVEGGEAEYTGLARKWLRNLQIHPDGRRVSFEAGQRRWEVWVMENFLPELRAAQ